MDYIVENSLMPETIKNIPAYLNEKLDDESLVCIMSKSR